MTIDDSGEVFLGHYRKDVKTSIWRVNGTVVPPEEHADLGSLLDSVPADAVMTGANPQLVVAADASDAEKLAAPATRFPQEQRNVTVNAHLWYIRKETDNDYHLILGSTDGSVADETTRYMTAEVSGLPANGDDLATLRQVRAQFVALVGSLPGSDRYEALTPPLSIRVTGSLFFDGDHQAGEIGPTGHRPQTVWEIHPVSDLEPL
jgi:hypothetical protein